MKKTNLILCSVSIFFVAFVFSNAFAHDQDVGAQMDPPPEPATSPVDFDVEVYYDDCRNRDSDDDGLCNTWERSSGLYIRHGGETWRHYCPPFDCPSSNTKDIFLEVDWMLGHALYQQAIDDVENFFADPQYGVQLHIEPDEELQYHAMTINTMPISGGVDESCVDPGNPQPPPSCNNSEANNIKRHYFGSPDERNDNDLTLKRQAFHYALISHNDASGETGNAEDIGNDIFLTLGNLENGIGSSDEQAGTLLHEIGHNLGLKHGGEDEINCKPNYFSTMSYSRQLPIFLGNDWSLQFSDGSRLPLDETALVEDYTASGFFCPNCNGEFIVFGDAQGNPITVQVPTTIGSASGIDWNQDGQIEIGNTVSANINHIPSIGCDSTDADEVLLDYNDWDFINNEADDGRTGFQFRVDHDVDFDDGAKISKELYQSMTIKPQKEISEFQTKASMDKKSIKFPIDKYLKKKPFVKQDSRIILAPGLQDRAGIAPEDRLCSQKQQRIFFNADDSRNQVACLNPQSFVKFVERMVKTDQIMKTERLKIDPSLCDHLFMMDPQFVVKERGSELDENAVKNAYTIFDSIPNLSTGTTLGCSSLEVNKELLEDEEWIKEIIVYLNSL